MENEINFMDLSRQCENIKDEVFSAFEKVYDSTAFVGGNFVNNFEKQFADYIGTKYASGISNGTDALFLACKALGIDENSEVIVPANTFIASAWAPLHCGAKIVFVDCKKDDWLIDPESVKKSITTKTRAIIGVHLYGQPYNVDAIKDLCEENDLKMIEDCAQAHGAKWNGKNVGTFGDVGCFSFYPGKNLGAFGDAGGIVSSDRSLIEKVNAMKDHGCMIRYHHDIPGYNMRLDGLQAAVLSVKLNHLDDWNRRRATIADIYYKEINNKSVIMRKNDEKSEGVNHLFTILVDNRDKFMKYMKENGINCGIHYPIPCHLQNAFNFLEYRKGDLPNSEFVADHCVSIPIFPELTDEELNHVVKVINSYE